MERERTARVLNCGNCDNKYIDDSVEWYQPNRCKITDNIVMDFEVCSNHSAIINMIKRKTEEDERQ